MGPDLVRDLFRLRFALWRGRQVEEGGGRPDDLLARWRMAHGVLLQHPVLDVGGLAIDGGDLRALGLRPGPRFGEILATLTERVIDDPDMNRKETLLEMVRRELSDE